MASSFNFAGLNFPVRSDGMQSGARFTPGSTLPYPSYQGQKGRKELSVWDKGTNKSIASTKPNYRVVQMVNVRRYKEGYEKDFYRHFMFRIKDDEFVAKELSGLFSKKRYRGEYAAEDDNAYNEFMSICSLPILNFYLMKECVNIAKSPISEDEKTEKYNELLNNISLLGVCDTPEIISDRNQRAGVDTRRIVRCGQVNVQNVWNVFCKDRVMMPGDFLYFVVKVKTLSTQDFSFRFGTEQERKIANPINSVDRTTILQVEPWVSLNGQDPEVGEATNICWYWRIGRLNEPVKIPNINRSILCSEKDALTDVRKSSLLPHVDVMVNINSFNCLLTKTVHNAASNSTYQLLQSFEPDEEEEEEEPTGRPTP